MTIEEKAQVLGAFCTAQSGCGTCPLGECPLPCDFGTDDHPIIDELYAIVFPPTTPVIKDSGERRQFDTGAVRDIQEGKGRCDLMPLDVVADYMEDPIFLKISEFQRTGQVGHLYGSLRDVPARVNYADFPTMLLEVAKHFEDGAKKYGENNWQKGIPVRCYIDSAVRHYLKWLRSDKDEPHDRAFCWNILCAIWTCKHKPELNDYAKKNTCITCGAVIPENWQYCQTCWENEHGG